MIKNRQFQTLFMDFEGLREYGIVASDIDFFHICEDSGALILGEIKNEQGHFTNEQKRLYSFVIDNHKQGGAILFIIHKKYAQRGDKSVDITMCEVEQYYYKGKWRYPTHPISVLDAIQTLEKGFNNDS